MNQTRLSIRTYQGFRGWQISLAPQWSQVNDVTAPERAEKDRTSYDVIKSAIDAMGIIILVLDTQLVETFCIKSDLDFRFVLETRLV